MDIMLQILSATAAAKRLHWTTRSFVRHVAMQEVNELLNQFSAQLAEECGADYRTVNINESHYTQNDVSDFINVLLNDLESFKNLMPKDERLVNTYEELQRKVSQVKCKLDNLSKGER